MKFKKPVGSFVVLTRNNRKEVFLVKRSDFPVWECQGGGVEKGETSKECAIREAFEETGFKIKLIRKVAEYKSKNAHEITSHIYEGEYISGEYKPEYSGCDGKWFKFDKIPSKMTATRKMMINDCLKIDNNLITKNEIPAISIQNLHLLILLPVESIKYLLKIII